jgi:ankyrin repeat protein
MNNPRQFDQFRALALDEDLSGMAAMLHAGFDVNAANESHQTVFMHCCANNRLRAAEFLARRGADLNLADAGGGTAMDFAVSYASRDLIDWLARAGGRRNSSNHYAGPAATA